ncbi:MAG: bifunctional 23S rRNA (guanine(2069)-N(7))-methyltransferase RlmK/23S rRNA (guanine(2445)-N(2))-methyltransferase RlmL [Planctomycetota bacterium]|nr:bifunctional 23S rRNA (guanine(2069)-N(7))-methyltransferase RlmK/23S rRNA (guanine(2445)-N(2))-methyltransferase RlmL [Planctomycetota bacterium]
MMDSATDHVELLATTAFGLEAVCERELVSLGFEPKIISTGRVWFRSDLAGIARANLWLRTADRVLLKVASFRAPDFDALFENTKAIAWERWLPRDAAFPVNGRSVKSTLTSVPAVQRTVKKAMVDRLMSGHRTSSLPETGPRFIAEIALLEDVATITLDTSGEGLHKRGYRDLVGEASLKETMAAGLVLLSVWRPHRPLVDPFCGTGTIPIEAAMIGLNMAPGIARAFDAEAWPVIPPSLWSDERHAARAASRAADKQALAYTIHASDVSSDALSLARRHADRGGVARFVHFDRRDFADLTSKAEYGCIIANPPYGKRLGEDAEVERLYRIMPTVLRRFPTWSHHILSARLDLEQLVGQQATRRRKLFNAQIECTYYQFLGPKPPRNDRDADRDADADRNADTDHQSRQAESSLRPDAALPPDLSSPSEQSLESDSYPADSATDAGDLQAAPQAASANPDSPARERPILGPAFGGLRERDRKELDEFEARLAKRARHLRKWPSRGITCYRLYERDCPDVPVVVDRYEDHAHVFEHEREHSRTLAQHEEWIEQVCLRTARVLDLPDSHVHAKSRPKQRGLTQHEKLDARGTTLVASEGGLKFEVNLTDYADTGLFLDHRLTRGMVRELAAGKRFLNLFCYTGSFTVYAAAGGAASTTSVDLSNTYLEWAERNLRLNGLAGRQHRFVRSDVLEFLRSHPQESPRGSSSARGSYDLAVVDPPTFSNSKNTREDWIVQEQHVELLTLVADLLSPGGVVFFSTNYRRFKLDEESLPMLEAVEISHRTVPEDFRNERIHRCWRMRKR